MEVCSSRESLSILCAGEVLMHAMRDDCRCVDLLLLNLEDTLEVVVDFRDFSISCSVLTVLYDKEVNWVVILHIP